MGISNKQIADIFNEMADLLETTADNYYRARAYRNAARVLKEIHLNVAQMVSEEKDLTIFPGIGKALAVKIKNIVTSGQLPQFTHEDKNFPFLLTDLKRTPGLGKKKIAAIFKAYPFENIEQLKELLISGQVAELPGFSVKSCQELLEKLNRMSFSSRRFYLSKAEVIVEKLLNYLKKSSDIINLEVVGSYRRRQETVGNLNIVAASNKKSEVIHYFTQYIEVSKVLLHSETDASVMLWSDMPVTLHVVAEPDYGAALFYYTGSKAYNTAINNFFQKKQLQITAMGFFLQDQRLSKNTELEIFASLALPYIEPEIRESSDVLTIALNGKLPKLIQLTDLRGDLHSHTNSTDGKFSLEMMAAAAAEKGHEYLAITDHSQSLTITNGLNQKRLIEQIRLIDKLNENSTGFIILKSIEVDILADGSLDLPDDILKELDLRVCSVHSKFNLSAKEQTERIIRAMDNPYFNILGHATGRLINHREPYQVNIEKIILAAKERHCILEINSHPARLDINDVYARFAKNLGVKLAISSDAHNIKQLNLLRFGVNQARRAGLEAKDVINTYPLDELKKIIRR